MSSNEVNLLRSPGGAIMTYGNLQINFQENEFRALIGQFLKTMGFNENFESDKELIEWLAAVKRFADTKVEEF